MDLPMFKPHSCRHCAALAFYLPYDDVKRGDKPIDALGNFSFVPLAVKFSYSVLDLLKAAGDGCSFAQLLLDGKETIFNLLSQMEDKALLSATLTRLPGDANINSLSVGFSVADSHLCNCLSQHLHRKNDIFEETKISLLVYASSDNPASKFIRNRPVNVHVASEETFRLTHGWLNECLESHPNCPKPDSQYKPTRLIEIIAADDRDVISAIRLHVDEFEGPERYTALSYCWGGYQTLTATKESLSDLVYDIPLQNLPKTINDAVITTHKLGIRFLWVDSLCIIQDDDEDKSREIPEMPKIYGNSSVTIIASRASHVGEGFLQDRDVTSIHAGSSEVQYRGPDDTLGSIVLCRELDKRDEPIDKRAWTLQERLLSPRILEYGTYQVNWICPTATHDDGWKAEKTRTKIDRVLDEIVRGRDESVQPKIRGREFSASWRQTVASYTSRSLTFPADRMRAISGIAKAYGMYGRTYQYLAGLWTSDLPGSLLWTIRKTLDDPPYYQPQPRPKTHQYPSWSWVSVPAPVSIHTVDHENSEARLTVTSYLRSFISSSDTTYGDIDLGELTVNCRLLPATYTITARTSSDEPILTLPEFSPKDGVLDISAVSDAIEEDVSEEIATTIPVIIAEVSSPLSFDDKDKLSDQRITMYVQEIVRDSQVELGKGGLRAKRRGSLYDSAELSGQGLILRKLDTGMYSRLGIYKMRIWKGPDREAVQSQEEIDQIYPFTNCTIQTIVLI